MTIYNIITAICLAFFASIAIGFIVSLLKKNHSERIIFLRSFKKGKCAFVYIVSIPLFYIGHIYAGNGAFSGFFSAVNDVIMAVVLRYSTSGVSSLMGASRLYEITIYVCFSVIGLNALLFTFSLVNQYVWSWINGLKFKFSPKKKLYVLGNNEKNLSLYKSAKDYSCVVVSKLSAQEKDELYLKEVPYFDVNEDETSIEKIVGLAKKSPKEIIVVVNTLDDTKNIRLCRKFIDRLNLIDVEERKKIFNVLKVFVFGDPQYVAIYEDIVSSAFGVIQYVNKYQRISMDLIDKHPITEFMTGEHIDYETSLIRDGVDINVFLIGFGKTNQQVYLSLIANHQFLTKKDGVICEKPVNYVIFDNNRADSNKNLNHNYYRFKNEKKNFKEEDYLPMPKDISNEIFCNIDINDAEFYSTIRKMVENEKSVNYVVIAFGSDLENLDMAQKLVEKRQEWGSVDFNVFVKVRDWKREQTLIEDDCCHFFGNEEEVVYSAEKIINDKIFRMAQMRNEIYDIEYAITTNEGLELTDDYILKSKQNSKENWYLVKSQLERESSLYACLSLRSKLNLLGLDIAYNEENDKKPLTEKEYLEIYAKGDMPNFSKYSSTAIGKPIASYSLNFKDSRRKTMAIQDHNRWNAFMITKGIVPSSISQILTEKTIDENGNEKFTNGKNYKFRRHGNITTFDGLVTFRQMLAKRDNKPEEKYDVIKYDYQILDDAFWMVSSLGMKMFKR